MSKLMGVKLSRMDGELEIVLNGGFRFNWKLTTGGAPHKGFFPVDAIQDEKIRAAQPFTSRWKLTFEYDSDSVEFTDLFLMQRGRIVQGSHVVWHIVDRRYVIQDAMIDSDFNRLRTQNGFIRNSGIQTNPSLTPFQQVRIESFIGATLKQQGADDFAGARAPGTGVEPWTALSALRYLLTGAYFDTFLRSAVSQEITTTTVDRNVVAAQFYGLFAPDGVGFRFGPIAVESDVVDNGYILKNWNPQGSYRKAINTLERLAHVVVYVRPNGQFAIAPADPSRANAALQQYGWYERSGGIPNLQYTHPAAPKVYRRYFTTRREHRCEYDEWFDRNNVHPDPSLGLPNTDPAVFGGPNGLYDLRSLERTPEDVLFLEPVLRLPQDTASFQKGQWVTLQDAFNEWNVDTSNFPRPLKELDHPFSHKTLQDLPPWAGTALASLFLRDRDRLGFRNKVLEARISTMYDYRKFWRIPEAYLDSITSWNFELASIFATTTRSRQPSPVWCDYLTWDSVIDKAKGEELDPEEDGQGYIRNVPLLNPFSLTADQAVRDMSLRPEAYPVFDIYSTDSRVAATPFRLATEQNSRGVFRIEDQPDLEAKVHSRYLGLYDPDTVASRSIGGLNAVGQPYVTQVNWSPIFRFYTILSIVWRTPNHARKSYFQEVDGTQILTGAAGPTFEKYYYGYEAYQVHDDTPDGRAKYRYSETSGQLFVDHPGEIGNEDVLTEITRSEAVQHYFRFRPKVLGTYRKPGVIIDTPVGHIQATGVNAQQGRVEAFAEAEKPPRVPDAVAGLEPDVKDIIQRLPEGTSGA